MSEEKNGHQVITGYVVIYVVEFFLLYILASFFSLDEALMIYLFFVLSLFLFFIIDVKPDENSSSFFAFKLEFKEDR